MALFNRKKEEQTGQSSPKPSAEEYLALQEAEMQEDQKLRSIVAPYINPQGNGAVDGFQALAAPIGKEAVAKATQILQKYKEGKANLERRITENEQWYKLRHWECLKDNNGNPDEPKPTSAWLFNAIANKHADAMDNFPSPNVLPREENDKGEAEMLSSIIPVILEQNDFEQVYDEVWNYKLKTGTGVYGVFWNPTKHNIGDIDLVKTDILALFWEPGITDIQKSRNLFHAELCDNEVLEAQYPQLRNTLGQATVTISKYLYDDSVDTTNKSAVIDWYYKKTNSQGKQVLHYVKYVNDTVLYATENTPELKDRGLYDHGKYPFEFDPLFRVEGTPAGFGYIDVGKSAQEYIDRGNQAIMENMLSNTRPRYFIRNDGSVNEEEFANMKNDFVHVDGQLGQDSILPINGKPLSEIYSAVIDKKIEELKETTGNRDVSTGGTTSGVTAASGIAAMQEASSKLSRDANKSAYRVFRNVCLDIIELIRQFYDLPRCFRIMGVNGMYRYITYNNAGIQPQPQGADFGIDMGYRTPLFDVTVSAQKQSPYSKMAQNELAIQFYQLGFFNPAVFDQALTCLDMMDFDRKEMIIQKITQNGMMYQNIMAQSQMMGMGSPQEAEDITDDNSVAGGSTSDASESPITKKARERTANLTSPT